MNASLDINNLSDILTGFLHRFHIVIFVLVVIGGLSVATLLLSNAMNPTTAATPPTGAPSGTGVTVLDTETMKKVKALQSDSAPLTLPAGRTNPFN